MAPHSGKALYGPERAATRPLAKMFLTCLNPFPCHPTYGRSARNEPLKQLAHIGMRASKMPIGRGPTSRLAEGFYAERTVVSPLAPSVPLKVTTVGIPPVKAARSARVTLRDQLRGAACCTSSRSRSGVMAHLLA